MSGFGGAYHERVREYFATPAHAGDLAARYPVMLSAGAAAPGGDPAVRFTAGSDGVRLLEVRFRAFGCPHLIAAAEAWCRQVEGRPAASAGRPAVSGLMAELGVPVEKTGRLLVLEDAWLALLGQFERERNTAKRDQY